MNFTLKLKREFYLKNAELLAQKLLGKLLILKDKKGTLVGKIVETEAYLGIKDAASHSYQGKITLRNKIMYEEGGLIYVYLIYGIHFCFNIVANRRGVPEAVFIRALQPLKGIEIMKKKNKKARTLLTLTNGPCRWTKSFGINKNFLGEKIYGEKIYILNQPPLPKNKIIKTKRVGVDYAKEAKDWLLRFYIKDNPFVSLK